MKIVKSDCQTAIVSALDAQFQRVVVSSAPCGCAIDAPCASCCYLLHTGTLFKRLIKPFTLESRREHLATAAHASLFSKYKNAPETLNFIVRAILCRVMLQQMCESLKCQKLLSWSAPFRKMTFFAASTRANDRREEGNRQLSHAG